MGKYYPRRLGLDKVIKTTITAKNSIVAGSGVLSIIILPV